jgi:adenosine deaminase
MSGVPRRRTTYARGVPSLFPIEAVRSLPKAELHVHLEGTVDAATILALAERHKVRPPADDVAGVETWYRFDDFPMFLERYFTVLRLLQTPSDFALIAERYLEQASAQGVVHVEFHVSASGHIIENGGSWTEIHDGIVEGCRNAAKNSGISWGLIPDISPHLPAAQVAVAMEQVFAHNLDHIVAIGMGGPADTWATDDFAPIFARARELGIPGVSHAGEHGGPAEVTFAVEHFKATRIQHGIGAAKDPAVLAMLASQAIPCDVCPGSNLALNAVGSPAEHPLPLMLAAGVIVTIGSDDPPMFQTTLLDDYKRAWDWCNLDLAGVTALARNSITSSFASDTQKAHWLTMHA